MFDLSGPVPGGKGDGVVIVSACSSAFFEYYLDLIESLDEVGLASRASLALIDLGLSNEQRRLLERRGVDIQSARWPIEPPAAFARLEFFGFVAKPFLRELFPGFEIYLWLDADMWVQDAVFFEDLCNGAAQGSFVVASEADRDYRAPSLKLRLWMFNNYRRGYGLTEALRMSAAPIVNNSLAAAHHDAPHWSVWQRDYRQLVSRARRLVAMDQLSLQRALFSNPLPVDLLPATDDWVCSRALPAWDRATQLFVTPGRRWSAEPHRVISVMHLTTPTRGRAFPIRDTKGGITQRYLHRPGGHVARLIEGGLRPRLPPVSNLLQSESPGAAPQSAPDAANATQRRSARSGGDAQALVPAEAAAVVAGATTAAMASRYGDDGQQPTRRRRSARPGTTKDGRWADRAGRERRKSKTPPPPEPGQRMR